MKRQQRLTECVFHASLAERRATTGLAHWCLQQRFAYQHAHAGAGDDLNWRLLFYKGGSVAEWLACWTQAQKGPGSNRSRDAVG